MKKRATFLDVTEKLRLSDWAEHVVPMFGGEVPYLVGSVLDDPNYRDVDIRLILDDDAFARLSALIDVRRLGFVVSLWGQQVTGLRIDFQIQEQTTANEEFKGPRHAIGLGALQVVIGEPLRGDV